MKIVLLVETTDRFGNRTSDIARTRLSLGREKSPVGITWLRFPTVGILSTGIECTPEGAFAARMESDSESVQSRWPEDARFLIPGVNDTWNLFQKFSKGKSVNGRDWKVARQALHDKYQIFLAEGGSPESISEDAQRFENMLYNLIGFQLGLVL